MNSKNPATIIDVARSAGVSTATVSRMINRVGPISTETERRVRKAIASLNYTRRRRRSTNGATPGTVPGAVTAKRPFAFLRLGNFPENLQHPMTNAVMQGLDRAARADGRSLTVAHVSDLSQVAVRDVIGDAEGVVIRTSHQRETIDQVIEWLAGIPAVIVLGENRSGRTLVDHVKPDNAEVGTLAADYLIGQGCRHLVFASTDSKSSVASERCLAFVRDARQQDMPVNIVLLGEGVEDVPLVGELAALGVEAQVAGSRQELVRTIASISQGAFGLFMPRDFELAMVMPQLQMLGVDFGKDAVAIGCDNEQRCLAEMHPMPASINLHIEHVAERAIRRLNYRLTHPDEPRSRLTVSPDLVLPTARQGTASAPSMTSTVHAQNSAVPVNANAFQCAAISD